MFTTTAFTGPVMQEYLRPWKLMTLAVGLLLLVAGSFHYRAPDWDVPISLITGLLAHRPGARS